MSYGFAIRAWRLGNVKRFVNLSCIRMDTNRLVPKKSSNFLESGKSFRNYVILAIGYRASQAADILGQYTFLELSWCVRLPQRLKREDFAPGCEIKVAGYDDAWRENSNPVSF
jgi:hypothetical protein